MTQSLPPGSATGAGESPAPQLVWYNDWRQVTVPALGEFTPERPVSVIVPYYAKPEELARTLAALEGQTYPRDLFEVVIVDDGSPEPVAQPQNTPLNLKVVRQESPHYWVAGARNTGVRAAAHDILVFLDADLLPEADWLAAHARWHHVLPDALTLGLRAHVAVDGVDSEMIRQRPGTLKKLFEGRETDPAWFEAYWARTLNLTSKAEDPFRTVAGGNLGVRRQFYELVGGNDESFTRWGGEDVEFGYRAYTRGGLLVPARDAFAWHQGRWEENRADKDRNMEMQRAKMAHLMAHRVYRTGETGRTFTVPQYVVTIEGTGKQPAKRLLHMVERVLANSIHDLVVRLELPADYPDREWLERHLGPDPRVRTAASGPALAEFPASPFHVTLPAGRPLPMDVVHRLRTELDAAVIARCIFFDGTRASITRAWALHRAQRTPWEAFDFGEVVTIPAQKLQMRPDEYAKPVAAAAPTKSPATSDARPPAPVTWRTHLRNRWRQVRSPVTLLRFVRWFGGAILRRVLRRFRIIPPPSADATKVKAAAAAAAFPPRSEYPLGVEIAALGVRSQAVFAASRRVARTTVGQHLDLVVVDTAAEAADVEAPVAILAEAPPILSAPAFDARTDNQIGWRRHAGKRAVGALGPLDLLPPDCGANRVVRSDDQAALRGLHHLEDVAAFHADAATRAGELARLAATGVVVHLADGDVANRGAADGNLGHRDLAPYLGAELFKLMTSDARNLDGEEREALSVRMRREALRTHSLTSRVRQAAEHAALPDPPRPPLVSILLATRRPKMLEPALAAVRRQTWPRLELILGLHGEGFGEVAPDAAGPSVPVTALRLDAALPLGSVLNALTEASRGMLLAKMDDDDLYGADHILDLVLAHECSQAPLVGKGTEFVYLAGAGRTIRCFSTGRDRFDPTLIGGGALLIERHTLDSLGGWKRLRGGVDQALIRHALLAGECVHRTHPHGFLLVRHGRGHIWKTDDAYFFRHADVNKAGFRPEIAGIDDAQPPYSGGSAGT